MHSTNTVIKAMRNNSIYLNKGITYRKLFFRESVQCNIFYKLNDMYYPNLYVKIRGYDVEVYGYSPNAYIYFTHINYSYKNDNYFLNNICYTDLNNDKQQNIMFPLKSGIEVPIPERDMKIIEWIVKMLNNTVIPIKD